MTRKTSARGPRGGSPSAARSAADIAADLEMRAAAAKNAEAEILGEVPLLYGSPGRHAPDGDPGVAIARLHQQDLRRRHGLMPQPLGRHERNQLPFERLMLVSLAILLLLFLFFD